MTKAVVGNSCRIRSFTQFEIKTHEISFKNDSKEAFEFAAEMWGLDLEEEGLVFNEQSGTYERQDMDITESPTMG